MRLFPASLAAALVTVRGQIRMSSSLPVAAVCQMTATPDKEANFSACTRLVEQAKEGGASMVFLPEGFDYIGSSREETLALSESLDGDIITRYTHLARKLDLWLSLGGFHERGHDWKTDRRIYNSHVIINGQGEVVSVYRKAHLFDVELTSKGVSLKESAFTVAGPRLLPPVQTPIGKVGLGVCYDLRFPELSSALQRHGAEILTFPSAFTVATGAAHWERHLVVRLRNAPNRSYAGRQEVMSSSETAESSQFSNEKAKHCYLGGVICSQRLRSPVVRSREFAQSWSKSLRSCSSASPSENIVPMKLLPADALNPLFSQVLLRARAIETQCFVLAAAQVGSHHSRRASYGHALAVDPWGGVIGDCGGTDAGVTLVQIDLQTLRDIRRDMPVQQHRREKDFYCSLD